MLHGCKQLDSLHKIRRHLSKYCKRCWKKTWYFKLWIRLDTSNYELDIPLPKGENKIVIELMKDELDA